MSGQNLTDLNGYLFEQMERLSNDDISDEEFEKEVKRTTALTDVAEKIIDNATLRLKAASVYEEFMDANKSKPKLLE